MTMEKGSILGYLRQLDTIHGDIPRGDIDILIRDTNPVELIKLVERMLASDSAALRGISGYILDEVNCEDAEFGRVLKLICIKDPGKLPALIKFMRRADMYPDGETLPLIIWAMEGPNPIIRAEVVYFSLSLGDAKFEKFVSDVQLGRAVLSLGELANLSFERRREQLFQVFLSVACELHSGNTLQSVAQKYPDEPAETFLILHSFGIR